MLPGYRLGVTLHGQARLPLTYREGLQAALYAFLPEPLRTRLHNQGLGVDGKPLKLFVYSRLEDLRFQDKAFLAQGEVRFYFATALPEVLEAVERGLWTQGGLSLYGHPFRLLGLEHLPLPLKDRLMVRALSPITVYRHLEGKTRYYRPQEPDFAELLAQNLNQKAQALGLSPGPLRVRPLGVGPQHKKMERYKGTWVEAWMGRYRLEGPPHLLALALLTGLGAKNSQGFGFVREVEG